MFLPKFSNLCKIIKTNNLIRFYAISSIEDIELSNPKLKAYLESLSHEYYNLRVNTSSNGTNYVRMKELNGVVSALEQQRALEANLISPQDIENEKDEDMRKLMQEENEVYGNLLAKTKSQIINELLKLMDDASGYRGAIFEVNAGAGGQEAMLFAKELFEMYLNYFDNQGWEYDIIDEEKTDIGGLRHASVEILAEDAYRLLRGEGGVHRVQRVPATEKSGRTHTSTASIAVIPHAGDVELTIHDNDIKIETKRASGAGGQHVNTTDSAVRVIHIPTGIAVECQSDRSQLKNRELALKKLRARLLQQQFDRLENEQKTTRKQQQGTLNRNEKIRTYNFVQDRITDHRLQNGTVYNLEEYMKGGVQLDNFMQRLLMQQRKQQLLEILNTLEEKQNK